MNKKVKYLMLFIILMFISFVVLYWVLAKFGIIKYVPTSEGSPASDITDVPKQVPKSTTTHASSISNDMGIDPKKIPIVAIIAGGCVIGISLLVMYFFLAREKPTAYSSPEKCQQAGFKLLTKLQNTPIRFENGKGSWLPPVCYNLTKDRASARVVCGYSMDVLPVGKMYPTDLRRFVIVDMSQKYPKSKFFWVSGMTLEKYLESKIKMFMHERGKLDAFKFGDMPPFMEEFVGKAQARGMEEKIKDMVMDSV